MGGRLAERTWLEESSMKNDGAVWPRVPPPPLLRPGSRGVSSGASWSDVCREQESGVNYTTFPVHHTWSPSDRFHFLQRGKRPRMPSCLARSTPQRLAKGTRNCHPTSTTAVATGGTGMPFSIVAGSLFGGGPSFSSFVHLTHSPHPDSSSVLRQGGKPHWGAGARTFPSEARRAAGRGEICDGQADYYGRTMIRPGRVLAGLVRLGMMRHGMERNGSPGLVWIGVNWHGTARCGMAWHDVPNVLFWAPSLQNTPQVPPGVNV
eukprot:gene11541-biopygen331